MDLTKIVNEVLTLFGRPTVANVNDDDAAKMLLESTKSLLTIQLSEYNWSFAIKSEVLSREVNAVSPRFKYAYALPGKMLRRINAYKFYYDSKNVAKRQSKMRLGDYVIEDYLYTNSDDVMLQYITSQPDLSDKSAMFNRALEYLVASENAIHLTENVNLKALFDKQSKTYLNRAKLLDFNNHSDALRY
jgi:hypothetical protein